MNNFAFVSALIRGDWAIEERFALNSMELVNRILSGTFIAPKADQHQPNLMGESAARGSSGNSSSGDVMVLKVQGPLMKMDQECGPIGMATMTHYIKNADNNPNIIGTVLHIDSPGGTVDGTEVLAKAIKDSKKPIVAFIDGLAASAALWVSSAADHVMVSTPNDEVGCVGVMLNLMDIQPAYERQGVKFHSITSDQTPDKNADIKQVLKGEYQGYKDTWLNPLADVFIGAVKANRPGVNPDHLTGKKYFAKDVMGSLVDSIGTIEDAVAMVFELAGTQSNSNHNITGMTQFERINAALGVEQLESVDGSVSLNEDQLTAIEGALAANAAGTEADDLREQLNAVNSGLTETQSALETAQNDLQARESRITELEARVAELEEEPGAETAHVVKPTDAAGSTNPANLTAEDIKLFNAIRTNH